MNARRVTERRSELREPSAEPERAVVRALLPEPKRGTFHCVYCGAWTFSSRACKAHRDLPQLEYGGF